MVHVNMTLAKLKVAPALVVAPNFLRQANAAS